MKSSFGWFSVVLFACLVIAAPVAALVNDRPDRSPAGQPAHLEMEIRLQDEDLVIQGEDRIGNLTIKIRAEGIEMPTPSAEAELAPSPSGVTGSTHPSIRLAPSADLASRLLRSALEWGIRMFIQFLTA